MLDREFLEDYERKESKEISDFENKVIHGRFSIRNDRFPPNERFPNIQDPAAYRSAVSTSIWPLVPISGSVIIPLSPEEKRISIGE